MNQRRTPEGLPILPEIPEVYLDRHGRPFGTDYDGPIEVGDVFAWEVSLPYARELIVVTRIGPPAAPLHVPHARGDAFISQGSEEQIWTRPIMGGREVNNDVSRFREAVIPTIFNPMSDPGDAK